MREKIKKSEQHVVGIFLQKIAKIPAVIEVMRPYVIDEHAAFGLITRLHFEGIISEYQSIYDLLEHNARLNDQYAFLMRLSIAIPELQKDTYFLYIRDFVISYEHLMNKELPRFNRFVKYWNRFVRIKNWMIIGYLFPGREMIEI